MSLLITQKQRKKGKKKRSILEYKRKRKNHNFSHQQTLHQNYTHKLKIQRKTAN